jgi:phosphatidylinositol-bisphosphatase
VFCGTWNVNGKALKEGNLADWLYPDGTYFTDGNKRPLADVYIIGFQEAVDLNAVNVAMDTETRKRCSFWQDSIGDCLNNSGVSYRHIANKYLVGLIVFVYVKESIASNIRDVRTTSTGVGVMGMLGNKGGACIRFTLFDSAVCVVCAHLAAHRENVAGRNADYANILEKSVFLPGDASPTSDGQNNDGAVQGNTPTAGNKKKEFQYKAEMSELSELKVTDHDVVFWVGDLNYRIDESVPMEEVFQRIENNDMDLLREMDQLNIERARGNCFQEFHEGRLNFAPTYKYQPGTDEYDRRPEKKIRAPAWCDRILWRINKESAETVDQICYTRAELKPSDHKPVSALFDCSLRRIISDKQTAVFEDLLRELDKWENDSIPRVELSSDQIDLGVLHFMEKHHTSVKLRNVGTSIAHWHLVAKLEEKRVSKRFITYTPQLGMLLPGEVSFAFSPSFILFILYLIDMF